MKKIALFFLILMITVQYGCNKNNSQNNMSDTGKNSVTGIEIGNKIPEFVFYDLNMNKIESSNYAGKPLILNFWATWCPPCREEMPSIESFYGQAKEKGIEIAAISVDDSLSTVSEFLKTNSYSFPIYFDNGGVLSRIFLIRSIPTTYIINKEGIIIDKKIGGFDWTTIDTSEILK